MYKVLCRVPLKNVIRAGEQGDRTRRRDWNGLGGGTVYYVYSWPERTHCTYTCSLPPNITPPSRQQRDSSRVRTLCTNPRTYALPDCTYTLAVHWHKAGTILSCKARANGTVPAMVTLAYHYSTVRTPIRWRSVLLLPLYANVNAQLSAMH